MNRYYYQLTDERYNDLGAFIPDGSNKRTAVNRAKRWMKENNVKVATLAVNSMLTANLLDVIDININNN